MKYINFNETKIFYTIKRKRGAATLLFLHGFCEDSSIWTDYIEQFKNFQILLVDLPGFGASELLEEYSIETLADIVNAVVAELDIKKFFLIGHSMGGYISVEYARKYEQNLEGLILFHSHPFADSIETKEKRDKSIDFIKRHGSAFYVKELFPQLFTKFFNETNRNKVDSLIFRASKYPQQGIICALKAMKNRPDNSRVLKNIKKPVLFLISEEDAAIPKAFSLKQTHLPDISKVHILKRVNHMGMFEKPKKTASALKEFFEFCLKL